MKSRLIPKILVFGALILLGSSLPSAQAQSVLVAQLQDDTVNPVTAGYIEEAIDKAEAEGHECLILKLDTPGGLVSSTRRIVKKILASKVPVIVYIAPSGSRAGSAGVFITYASHVAAMAPSTNIGAAHPVSLGGGKESPQDTGRSIEELMRLIRKETAKKVTDPESATNPLEDKILNDTVAFIRSLAKERGRDENWAIKSVKESSSITVEEALELKVVELAASSDRELLEKLHGRVVVIGETEKTLDTKDAGMDFFGMSMRQRFLNFIANPNVAYFLLILGFYALVFEVTHPGIGVPGVLGAIFLILSFFSMQMLPTNYAGLALIVLGIILLISELYVPGFGLLTLGGVVSLVLGSTFLFESADPLMRVSLSLSISLALTTALITLLLIRMVLRAHMKKSMLGDDALVGKEGVAETKLEANKKGKVFVHGELWNAVSDQPVKKGEKVRIIKRQQMTLQVQKI